MGDKQMSVRELRINDHGGMFHFISLCIATKICNDRGYKILDSRWFKDKQYYKGEPDIYFEVPDKKHPQRYVLEIETNPTTASIELKEEQFMNHVMGVELLIADMRKVLDQMKWMDIEDYLKSRIP
jgi:hypothetical protein